MGAPRFKSSVRKNKYGAIRCKGADGRMYDSKNECARSQFLQMLERNGKISNLEYQPRVVLLRCRKKAPTIAWKLDFAYDQDGKTIYEDSKPRKMDGREKLLARLWQHFGPGTLLITGSSRDRFRVLKTIEPDIHAE